MEKKKTKSDDKQDKPLEVDVAIKGRWSTSIIDAGKGWTAVPNFLLERQQALGIDPVKMNILLVLLKHWWTKNEKPFPSKRTIAETIGRDTDTVRKHIKEMEARGLLQREAKFHSLGGQKNNVYDMSGLVAKLKEFADSKLDGVAEQNENESRERRGLCLSKINWF